MVSSLTSSTKFDWICPLWFDKDATWLQTREDSSILQFTMTSQTGDPDAFSGCTKNEVKQRVTQLNPTL